MFPSEVDMNSFGKEDFDFPGNYRAIVEDNEDPLGIGRVRIRILGIHSLDVKETPVDHLPWAEPCLNMYSSGGKNIDNKSQKDLDRYKSAGGSNFEPPKRDTEEVKLSFVDYVQSECGTGGYFTVPRKGSQVWVFFENNDHTRPQYWSLAPKKDDWLRQKKKLVDDINVKKENAKFWRDTISSLIDPQEHVGKSVQTQSAQVKTINEKPKIDIFNIDDIENHNITSYTSPGGVTHITVTKDNLEKHYIIHKGTIEYIEHNGQKKIMIGNNGFKDGSNSGKGNDLEELIANNYEIHIGGDFEVFVKNTKSIQIEGDYNLNVNKNVGIVSRNGNVNIVVEKGDVNIDTTGNANVNVGGMAQIHVAKDMMAKVDGKASIEVAGKTSLNCDDNISINSGKSISFKADQNITFDAGQSVNVIAGTTTSFKCTMYSVTSPTGFHVNAGSTFRIDTAGFGGDKTCNAFVVNARHPGAFPGPIAGFSSPYPGTPIPPTPGLSTDPVVFSAGTKTTLQTPNPPAYTETQKNTVSSPPIQTSAPKNSQFLGKEV